MERTSFSVAIVEQDDRTVTLHGESLRIPLALGPVGFLYEYRRPTHVVDLRDGRETRHRIPDLALVVRVLAVLAVIALAVLRRRKL